MVSQTCLRKAFLNILYCISKQNGIYVYMRKELHNLLFNSLSHSLPHTLILSLTLSHTHLFSLSHSHSHSTYLSICDINDAVSIFSLIDSDVVCVTVSGLLEFSILPVSFYVCYKCCQCCQFICVQFSYVFIILSFNDMILRVSYC